MELPRFVALKSTTNDKYLRYVNEDGPLHAFLQVNGEELVTPFTKFEVVKAKSGDGLVSMRSCYNNKFWLRASRYFNWIVVGADEPEEDETKWSCTLFKPVIHNLHGGVKTVSFHHVQLDHSVFFERNGPSHDSCLLAAPRKPDGAYCDVYTIIDWETMFVLPKHVAFKGDNGKYLRPQKIKGHEYKEYLQFGSKKLGDSQVGNAIFINRHGDIKIKSDISLIGGGVWKRNFDDWILANSNFPIIPPFVPGFGPSPVIPDHPKILGDLPFGPGPVIPDHPKIPGALPFGPGPVIPDHPKIPGDLPFGPGPVIPDHPNIPGDLPFGPGPVIPDHPKIPGALPFGPGPVIPDHPKIPGDLPFGPGPVIPDHPNIPGDLPFGPGPVIPDHPKIPGALPFGPGPVIPDHPKIPGDLPFGPGPVIPDHPKIPGDLPFGPGPVIPDHPIIPGDIPFGPGPVLPIPIPGDLPFPHGPGPVLPIPIPIFPRDSLFWPEKVANSIVALRNLGNDQYCKRYTIGDFTSCLSAIDTSISEYSKLEVEEIVTSRRIKTVNFFLMDGRIYDHVDIIIATEEVVNETNEPIIEDVKFSFPDTRSRCWNSSVSLKLYDLITMQAGNPFVVDGKIEVPNEEFRGSYRWGETQTSTTVVETVHTVSVPPKCKVKVTLTGTKASCDVPFSYSQQDILTNGHQVTDNIDDGIYTGINYFRFSYESLEENL